LTELDNPNSAEYLKMDDIGGNTSYFHPKGLQLSMNFPSLINVNFKCLPGKR